MEEARRIKIGIIGLGKLGILHTGLVNMIPSAELAALADINKQLAKYVQQSGLKAPFFYDLGKMLEDVPLDAAIVCTPASANLDIAETCVRAGLDMFIEKPLAHTFEAAKRIAGLVSRKDVVHATGYLFAHMGVFKKAKSLLETDVIGAVHRFRASMYTSEVFGRKKGWVYDRSQSGGGVVINVASHLLYLLHWYFGPVRSVFARVQNIHLDVEDAASVIFECDRDVTGTLDTSWSVPGYRLPYVDIRIDGENGTLELTNDYVKLYLYKAHKGFPKEWTTIHKMDLPVTSKFELGAEGLYEEDQDFVDCCLNRTSPAVTWRDGLEVQRLIEAIYRSAERKAVVGLEEVE